MPEKLRCFLVLLKLNLEMSTMMNQLHTQKQVLNSMRQNLKSGRLEHSETMLNVLEDGSRDMILSCLLSALDRLVEGPERRQQSENNAETERSVNGMQINDESQD